MMKKYLMIVLALGMAVGLLAQKRTHGGEKMTNEERQERFQSMKVAHLTKELDLTPEQAQAFWPVYNKYADEKKAVRDGMTRKKIEDMTEEEAEAFVEESQEVGQNMAAINAKMMEELKEVLSATQRAKLVKAEKDFHKDVVRLYSKKKRKRSQRDLDDGTTKE
jgi:Spy/CpxP family protein refolding chaperone